MRAVVQRVRRASVIVGDETVSAVGSGVAVLVGVAKGDNSEDARYISDKLANLRIFEDQDGKLASSLKDVAGACLLVSQFTLLGDSRRGRRPSFTEAAAPEKAEALFGQVAKGVASHGIDVKVGRFRSRMLVKIENDGPVTILLDSRRES